MARREFVRIETSELTRTTHHADLTPGGGTPHAELIRQVIAIEQLLGSIDAREMRPQCS